MSRLSLERWEALLVSYRSSLLASAYRSDTVVAVRGYVNTARTILTRRSLRLTTMAIWRRRSYHPCLRRALGHLFLGTSQVRSRHRLRLTLRTHLFPHTRRTLLPSHSAAQGYLSPHPLRLLRIYQYQLHPSASPIGRHRSAPAMQNDHRRLLRVKRQR